MPIRIFLSMVDGYFGPASAIATIPLAAAAVGLYILYRFFGSNRKSFVG